MRKRYSLFKTSALDFQKKVLSDILLSDEQNIKGIFLVLSQPDLGQVKRRENTRLIYELAFKGIEILKAQKSHIIG
jgi:hypothetical protein